MRLVGAIADELFSGGAASLVFLGSGDVEDEKMFRDLMRRYPDRVWGFFGFDNALAHRIEAGADIFLMPSLFEPCGLNQMYSMRYGTIPVVRATGGLEDTVDEETGYKFEGVEPASLLVSVHAALKDWRDRDGWRRRMLAAMSRDFSWGASAARYGDLYRRVLSA
jgi:starch synthase